MFINKTISNQVPTKIMENDQNSPVMLIIALFILCGLLPIVKLILIYLIVYNKKITKYICCDMYNSIEEILEIHEEV
jgi:hypothetical protein